MWKGWKFGEKSSLKEKRKIVFYSRFFLRAFDSPTGVSTFSLQIFFLYSWYISNSIREEFPCVSILGPLPVFLLSAIQHWKSSTLCCWMNFARLAYMCVDGWKYRFEFNVDFQPRVLNNELIELEICFAGRIVGGMNSRLNQRRWI